MRILVLLSHNPKDSFLVRLPTEEVIREIKKCIKANDNSKAMVIALTKGHIEASGDIAKAHLAPTDIIITRDRVSWDLVSRKKE